MAKQSTQTIIDEIIAALALSGPGDLAAVRRYIGWIKFRRMVMRQFYPAHHWVRSKRRYHWVGE